FNLDTMDGSRKTVHSGMQKVIAAHKKPGNIFWTAKKSLVSMVLALWRLMGKISLALAGFAKAFMTKLDNQRAERKQTVGINRHKHIHYPLLLQLEKNGRGFKGQVVFWVKLVETFCACIQSLAVQAGNHGGQQCHLGKTRITAANW